MDLNLPTIDTSAIWARVRNADPRNIDTSKVPSLSLPSIELPTKASLDGALGAASVVASDAGKAAAGLASDAGKAAATVATDAGRAIGSALETAGDRLRDLRTSVMPKPKRPSMVRRGAVALVIASIVGSIAAGAAFVFHPVRGAARRAAIRRRLGVGAGMTRTGVDTAVVAARRASDKVVELVRIPVETAKDFVGTHNGHMDGEAENAEETAVLAGVGAPVAMTQASDLQPENLGEAEPRTGTEAVGE